MVKLPTRDNSNAIDDNLREVDDNTDELVAGGVDDNDDDDIDFMKKKTLMTMMVRGSFKMTLVMMTSCQILMMNPLLAHGSVALLSSR